MVTEEMEPGCGGENLFFILFVVGSLLTYLNLLKRVSLSRSLQVQSGAGEIYFS